MLYRMLSVLLSALLLLSLASCGPAKTPPDTSAPSSAPGGPTSEASTPEAPGGIDPAAVVAVEEAVRLYQSGTTPENATQLPEGFVFPEVLDWDSIRSEEHTSELQSRQYLVCRLLLEKKNVALTVGVFLLLFGAGLWAFTRMGHRFAMVERGVGLVKKKRRIAFSVFFFNDTATTEIYTLSLHDALPI